MQLVKTHSVSAGIRRVVHQVKSFLIYHHMIIFALPVLFVTILYSRSSRENGTKNAPVVEGRIVSCSPAADGGPCIADIEFRMGNARVKKKSVRLQKSSNCMIGQRVKVQYSPRLKKIDIIE